MSGKRKLEEEKKREKNLEGRGGKYNDAYIDGAQRFVV